jgi:nicotinamidase-related amidase
VTSSQIVRDPLEDHLLTPRNAALLISDFQPVQVSSIASMDRRMLVADIFAVARTAKLFGLPIVLSTDSRDRRGPCRGGGAPATWRLSTR